MKSCLTWITILLAVLGVLVAALYGWSHWQTRATEHALAAARARWDARPFTGYLLVVERSEPPLPPCEQAAQIVDEQVRIIQRNTCQRSPQTVTELFDTIMRREPAINFQALIASSLKPECQESADVDVRYHPTLGYPEHIHSRFASHPAWLRWELWQYVWDTGGQLPTCSFTGSRERTITVRSLNPQS